MGRVRILSLTLPPCSFLDPFEYGTRGSVVVKPEVLGYETRLGEGFFFLICLILPAALGPGVYPASNRNEYHNTVSREQRAASA
jgi:hypothetical protein